MLTKGDLVGLYSQCVLVTLEDGQVVEQNIYPRDTHCRPIFIKAWTKLLNTQWNQVIKLSSTVLLLIFCGFFQSVSVECCNRDLCNKFPRDGAEDADGKNSNAFHWIKYNLLIGSSFVNLFLKIHLAQ